MSTCFFFCNVSHANYLGKYAKGKNLIWVNRSFHESAFIWDSFDSNRYFLRAFKYFLLTLQFYKFMNVPMWVTWNCPADDTNLLLSDKPLKKVNRHISHDLKLLNIWLRANKISLNASKTEIILFRPKSQSNITKHLNFRISGQYIERISEVKYLGLILNEFLSWGTCYTLLKKKLNRAIGFLSKVWHFTSQHLLKTIYYSLFNSHLIYGCHVWGQYQGTEFQKK